MSGLLLCRPSWMLSIIVTATLFGLWGPSVALADQVGASPLPAPSFAPVTAATNLPLNAATAPPPGRHHRHHSDASSASPLPSPSETSAPARTSFTTFAGTWEVALQHGATTSYTHFVFDSGDAPSMVGEWLENRIATPITGELDGDRFRFNGVNVHGPFTMTGYEENFTNLVGTLLQGSSHVPFTARHQGGPPSSSSAKHRSHRHLL